MKPLNGLILAALVAVALPLAAQTAESPPRYKWIATPCDTWGCAIAAMAQSNGDPNVIILPTKSNAHPWVVLKRMEIGVVDVPDDGAFIAECFGTMGEASARFSSVDSEKIPILITAPDGGMIVVCLHETQTPAPAKKRAVGH
jgi:hypothetical protein